MRIAVPHHTTKENARRILEQRIGDLEKQFGHHASEVERTWKGDTLEFRVAARGFQGKGLVEVTDTDIIIDGKLPLIAKPFESRIRSTVEREAAEIFRKA